MPLPSRILPGLVGSLLVGTLAARTIAIVNNIPFYPTHHLKSHIYANWLSGYQPEFPLLAAVISGGHTQIIHMQRHDHFDIIGTTRDDAIGECFDKIAKILGLPYPGGPSIAKAAQRGNPTKYKLPIPKVDDLDFSFSGLKTAVLRAVQKELNLPITTPSYELQKHLSEQQIADFAASFQATAVNILIQKLKKASQKYPAKSILLAGGVSANQELRTQLKKSFSKTHQVFFPDPKLSTDNGAMVASAAYTLGIIGDKAKTIANFAKKHRLILVEDSAHCLTRMATDDSGNILADISVHSFGVEKVFKYTKFGGAIYVNPALKKKNTKIYEEITSRLLNLPQPPLGLDLRSRTYRFQNGLFTACRTPYSTTYATLHIRPIFLSPPMLLTNRTPNRLTPLLVLSLSTIQS